jgi:hypothetical protein
VVAKASRAGAKQVGIRCQVQTVQCVFSFSTLKLATAPIALPATCSFSG